MIRIRKSRKLSLRLKITLLTALVITGIAAGIAAISIYSANHVFVSKMKSDILSTFTIQPASEIMYSAASPSDPAHFTATVSASADAQVMEYQIEAIEPVKLNEPIQIRLTEPSVESQEVAITTTQQEFNSILLWIMGLLVLVGTGAAWWLSGRALKPVKILAESIQDIDENNLSTRLHEKTRCAEVDQLTASFNNMMDKLDAAFETQKSFAAAAAHELKTPLSCIRTNIEVLSLSPAPTEQEYRETIEVTQRNTNRLIELVDDLLNWKLDQAPEAEAVEIAGLVGQVLDELAPRMQEKGIAARVRCAGSALVSRDLLYRALFNLVENAVKYDPFGGALEIVSQQEGECLTILVSDSGPGIPEEERIRVFDPFYRIEKSRSREQGGSGLGLALVKDIAERSGGSAEVRDAPEGACFALILPRAES